MKYLLNGIEGILALFMIFSVFWMMSLLNFDFSGENGKIFILMIVPAIVYSLVYGWLRWMFYKSNRAAYRFIALIMVCLFPFALHWFYEFIG